MLRVHVDEDKHKVVDLEIQPDVNLQFHAGNKDDAEAIVRKVEISKRIASGDSSLSPPSTPAANASSIGIKSPTPSAPLANGSRFLPPPAHPGLSPSPSGKSKGVHWDTAPPAEIAPAPQGIQSDEEEEEADPGPSSSGGAIAIAAYDFDADGEDELSVKEGERLTIIDREGSEEWWKCRNAKGQEGVVPASYLEVRFSPKPDFSSLCGRSEGFRRCRRQR